jgi:hypothetical protein
MLTQLYLFCLSRHKYHKSVNLAAVGPRTFRNGEKWIFRKGYKMRASSVTAAAPTKTEKCILYEKNVFDVHPKVS